MISIHADNKTYCTLELATTFDKTALTAAVDQQVRSGYKGVILDLQNIKMLDSMGLGALVMLQKQLTSQYVQFCICGLNATITKLIALTKLDKVMKIYPTTIEAQEAMSLIK